MSRRNQSSRRRSYGRRQHELRERRESRGRDEPTGWLHDLANGYDPSAVDTSSLHMLDAQRNGRAAA